ncbi:hypothetical protein ACFYXD_35425 [Streptomyces platensis]|uniref:hypothetical protein n=1 Tax=Streptomyces platensis TaxID=58346 RepID=UPI00369213B6
MTDAPIATNVTNGPVHMHFGLSYANYLVLPRTLMQSMPIEWQERMVACLDELDAAFQHVEQAEVYKVQAGTEHIVSEMTDIELKMAQVTVDRFGGERPPSKLAGEALLEWEEQNEAAEPTYTGQHGIELDANERVTIPTLDPVPHYNRGRTYVEPQLHRCDNCEGVDPASCLMNAARSA